MLFNRDFRVRGQIEHYLLLLSVPAILTFLMAVVYFPSKPPTPPSNSAKVPSFTSPFSLCQKNTFFVQEARLPFLPGAIQLLKNPNSWAIAIVWAIPQVIVKAL